MDLLMSATDGGRLTLSLLDASDFAGFRDPWNALLDESSCQSFFLKWEWLYTCWRAAERENAELLVVLCYDGPDLVGIAPLYAYATSAMKLPVTKVAFLGDRVAGDYMDVISRPGYEERCCRRVLQFLREDAAVRFDMVEIDAVCSDSQLFHFAGCEAAERRDLSVDFRFECPRAMLGSTYAEYVAGLTSSTRYAIGRRERRFVRRLRAVDVVNLDLCQHIDLLDVLFELHASRWETARPGESTFHSDFRKRFNRELLGRLESGDGYFSLVRADGRPVSIVYVFAYKKHAFFYQSGWSPEFASHGVGLIGVQEAIRHAANAGYASFDFLRGEEDYKYKFAGDVRRAYAIRMFGRGPRGRVLERLFKVKGGLKSRLAALRRTSRPAARSGVRGRSTEAVESWS